MSISFELKLPDRQYITPTPKVLGSQKLEINKVCKLHTGNLKKLKTGISLLEFLNLPNEKIKFPSLF